MKKSKIKWISLVISVVMGLGMCVPVSAQESEPLHIRMISVSEEAEFSYIDFDEELILQNDYTLVPIRALADTFSYDITWDSSGQKITLKKDEHSLEMNVGSNFAICDGKSMDMKVAPCLVHDRIMVPVRFISEFFHKNVYWQSYCNPELNMNNGFVWLSDISLLAEEDCKIDLNNYHIMAEDAMPFYELKENGQTARGLKIGDSYDKAVDLYGKPHEQSDDTLIYYSPGLPSTDCICRLIISLKNGIVTGVTLDGALE